MLDGNIEDEDKGKFVVDLEQQNAVLSRDDIIESSDSECEDERFECNETNTSSKVTPRHQSADVIVID